MSEQKVIGSILVPATKRIVVLTGATGAIGGQIAYGIAKHAQSYALVVAVRNEEKGKKIVDDLKKQTGNQDIFFQTVDLSSARSIHSFTQQVVNKFQRVDVLVNNAAVVPERREVTNEGVEMQFATNILAYFQLMNEFAPTLKQSAAAAAAAAAAVSSSSSSSAPYSRIVNVASNYAGDLQLNDLEFKTRSYDSNSAYRQSKQANRMLSAYAAKLYANDRILVNACHPGVVTSNLLQGLGMASGFNSAAEGAATPVFLAIDPSVEGKSGIYWYEKQPKACGFSKDEKGQQTLWQYCSDRLSKILQ